MSDSAQAPAAPREGMLNVLPSHTSQPGSRSTTVGMEQLQGRMALCVLTAVRDLLPKHWNQTPRGECHPQIQQSLRQGRAEPRDPAQTNWQSWMHRLGEAECAKGQMRYLYHHLLWGGVTSLLPTMMLPCSTSLVHRAEAPREVTSSSLM